MTSPLHRLFFALFPEADAASEARDLSVALRDLHQLRGRPTRADRLHISLNFVRRADCFESQVATRALAAAARVSTRPFVVALDRVVSWRGEPRPLVLTADDGVIGVHGLLAAIHDELRRERLVTGTAREGVPHMTLLRDSTEVPTRFISPIGWPVREFALVHSVHGEGRHNILGRWSLAAGQ